MIWVLLEITLPLCLAFLTGLGAGWLFWRWRRRSISQTEWNNQGKMSAADVLRFGALQEEADANQRRAEQLEATLQSQASQDSEKSEQTEESRQSALQREKQSANKIQELEFRSTNLLNTVDSQSNELKQSKKDIKRLREELKLANDKLNIAETNVEAEELNKLQEKLSLLTVEKNQLADQLKQTTKEASIHSNTAVELKTHAKTLEDTIERQADELLAAKNNVKNSCSEVESLKSQLEEQSKQLSDAQNKDDLISLQTKLDLLATEKAEIEQKLHKVTADADQTRTQLTELKRTNAEDQHALQSKLEAASAENNQLEQRLQDKSTHAEQQTRQYNELQQKLKQTETVATERDTAIEKIKQLEERLDAVKAQHSEDTSTELETLAQKFRSFKASTVAVREAREQKITALRTRVEQLQSNLEQEREKSSDSATDKEKQQLLEKADNATEQLDQAKTNITQLNNQIKDLTAQLSKQREEDTARYNRELEENREKLSAVTTQLNNARARNNQLAARIETINPSSQVTPISVAQINKLKTTVAEKEKRIEQLEVKLKLGKKKSRSNKNKHSWQKGETKIGTPGCDHKDDLTAINGIGPKIEKVLNRLGITSWEQLATLKASDIKLVDQQLVDFSGRIVRDEWVAQAKAIMRNGHEPIGKKAKSNKKPDKAKAAKNDWQTGQTKLGTPGSAHRDDLQVINGVGPVIEKSLNRYGIKSWEQLASLKAKDIKTIDEALDFPGRITREQWVAQAKSLVKQFPNHNDRPTRRTFLNQAASSR